MSRVNPYTRLKTVCAEWADKVRHPHTKNMFTFKGVASGKSAWPLSDVRERILAGGQVGYHVQVIVRDDDLIFQYVKDNPDAPWEIQ